MGSTGLRLTAVRGASALAILALAACGGSQGAQQAAEEDVYDDSFQLTNLTNLLRSAPDEFSVVTKRPLELPDDFDALPVPEPGKPSTRDPNPQADARAALLSPSRPGTPVAARGAFVAPSAGETAILSSIAPADPAIRQTLAAEQAEYESEQDQYLLDRVFPRLRRVRGDLDREQLDGNAERLRLLESGVSGPGAAPAAVPTAQVPIAIAPPVQGGPILAAPEPRPTAPTFGTVTPGVPAAPELIYLPE